MYDAPVVKYKKDKNKPKPGEKGWTCTADKAQAAYEKWKNRQKAEKQKGVKYDLAALMKNGEKKPVGEKNPPTSKK